MSRLGSVLLAAQLRWRFDRWSAERLLAHQRDRVRRLVAYAAEHAPYYRERIDPGTPLDQVPKMDKATMMAHFDAINTAGLRRDDLVAFRTRQEHERTAGFYPGGYSVGLSSGTSGNKVLTVLSPHERDRYAALLWARSGIPRGLRPKRVLFALRAHNEAFTTVTRFGITLVYVDYLQTPETLLRLVNEHRLNVLAGPPSILALLAERRREIVGPVDALVSYAEELDAGTRARLEAAFGARVAEIYQGAERMIGTTCSAGALHLNEVLVAFDDVHVHLCLGVVVVVQVADDRAVHDAHAHRGHLAHEVVSRTELPLLRRNHRKGFVERHPSAGDRGRPGAAVRLDDVAVYRDGKRTEVCEVDGRARASANEPLDLRAAAVTLAYLATLASSGRASRQHGVFGREPASVGSFQERREVRAHSRCAQYPRVSERNHA